LALQGRSPWAGRSPAGLLNVAQGLFLFKQKHKKYFFSTMQTQFNDFYPVHKYIDPD